MKVISLINEKGGVGKTTLAVHIAAGLAIRGQRVLLVDADAQGHATFALGFEKSPGFYDLLVRKAAWKNVLMPVAPEVYEPPDRQAQGVLYLLPGNGETALIANKLDNPLLLDVRLKELRDYIDVVIFDTSPTPSLLHGSIYMATDGILYPTECAAFSLQALLSTIENVSAFSEQRERLAGVPVETLGIVPTMLRLNTVEHSENLKALQGKFERVLPGVPERIIWQEAAGAQRPLFSFAPKSEAAAEAWGLVDTVMGYVEAH